MSEQNSPDAGGAPSGRTRVRRGANRALYGRYEVTAILDAGLIAHVGVTTAEGPLVLPMAYGRDDEMLYLHGAAANHLLKTGDDHEVCVTVTHLDGMVMARTPFHNSMNYRSVVVRGRARRIDDEPGKRRALKLITDHVVANWDTGRPASETDLRKTLVLELPLTEASAKVRTGDPIDEPDDIAGPWWAGVVPITTRFETPIPSADLAGGGEPPPAIAALAGRSPDERNEGGPVSNEAGAHTRPAVLFLCVHNAGRSQMAAGYLRNMAGDRVDVFSGGSDPGRETNKVAVAAMAEDGIDIAGELPKPWTDEIAGAADVIVTMGCGDSCPVYPGMRYEDWALDDPAGQPIEVVRSIRDDIRGRVEALLASLEPFPAGALHTQPRPAQEEEEVVSAKSSSPMPRRLGSSTMASGGGASTDMSASKS